jgi:parvulin-like peptidyl-prolyl isomerase
VGPTISVLPATRTASLSYIQQLMAQIDLQLEPATLGQNTIDYLVANQIIQQEADKRGITVSKEEVDKYLQDYMGYYPNGTPTIAPTGNPVPTSTFDPTQISLIPPTATALPTSTVTPTPVITVTQQLASPTPTTVVTPTATVPVATNTPLPTSTPYTLSEYEKNVQQYLSTINSVASLSEADLRWVFTMQLQRQKVYDAVTADISRQQDQVWARHIVVSDQTQAQSIYDRLTKGEDFETVATEVYSGTTNTIDLGWFGKGTLDSNAENIVWALQTSQISEPISTTTGWEIYQVIGHEVRTLTDSEWDTLKQTDFQKWIDEQKTAENVQTFDIWKTRVPTRPTVPPTQSAQ